jgi:hypothetical protein
VFSYGNKQDNYILKESTIPNDYKLVIGWNCPFLRRTLPKKNDNNMKDVSIRNPQKHLHINRFYNKFAIRESQISTIMRKNSGMRPQDIVILLKKISPAGYDMKGKDLAQSLNISPSEISESLERSMLSGLVDSDKKKVNTLALREFLLFGIRYCFPIQVGNILRGMPTYISASPISDAISPGNDAFVWKDKNGSLRGQSIEPLYYSVPEAAARDKDLYRLLVIVDTLRIGRTREREIAINELDKYLKEYVSR